MMRKALKISLAAIAVGTLVAGCGQSPNARGSDDSSDIQELVFAAVPSEESQELEESFAPVIKALEKETSLPVRFEAVSSNAGVVEAQVAERVDIAVYGAFSYYLASGVADVTPVAVDQREPGGESGVESYGIVRSDTPAIASLEDAQGKNVCFTDPASSTGYLSPSAGLIEAGIDVESGVEAIFAGGHDTAVTSLLAGDCDVAFAAATFVDELLPARGALKPEEVNKIWTSPVIPGPPVVVGNWLPEDLQTKIITALTKYDAVTAAENGFCEGAETEAPETWGEFAGKPSCVWGGTAAFAFVPTNDEAYEPIREICEITKAEVCTAEQQ